MDQFYLKILIDLLSEEIDVHFHGIGIRIEVMFPNMLSNLLFGNGSSLGFRQIDQQLEFLQRKGNLVSATINLLFRFVDDQIVNPDDILIGSIRWHLSSQQGVDPQQQLLKLERFHQIIISKSGKGIFFI